MTGTVTVAVTTSTNATRVEFWIDGVMKFNDTAAPFSYSWDTTTAPNGSVAVKAIAYTGTGRSGTAAMTAQVLNKYLIIRDGTSWGATADETILTAARVPYDVIASAAIGTTTLSDYRMIILPGDQPAGYYTAVDANLAALTTFVNGGRVLLYVMAEGWAGALPTGWTAPGGAVRSALDAQGTNAIAAAGHLLVGGVTSPFTGSSASHGHFTTLPAGTTTVTVVDGTTDPTLITYRVGDGLVIASSQPLEAAYDWGWPMGAILSNALSYGGNLETFRLVQPTRRGPATTRNTTGR